MPVPGSLADGQPPGWRHHFWDCAVAQSIVHVLQQQLVGGWCHGLLRPHHVLCTEPPTGISNAHTLHKGVWRIVCLAAVNAMDLGRRAACQANVQERHERVAAAETQHVAAGSRGQRLITDMFQPPLHLHNNSISSKFGSASSCKSSTSYSSSNRLLLLNWQRFSSRRWLTSGSFGGFCGPSGSPPVLAPNDLA